MILLTYGTRPEYIKLKPLIDVFDKNNFPYLTLFTGQHTGLIGEQNPDYVIKIPELTHINRLDSIIKSIMGLFTTICLNDKEIDYVLVQGDTTSAFAVALSAFHHGVKIIHLEAGLRTFDKDNPYPEETNRRMITQLADVHFCPTEPNANNVFHDKFDMKNVYIIGNTVIDNLIPYKKKCEYTDKILVTLHRRENHHWMDEWFKVINSLAEMHPEYKFILPIHPNPNVQKHKHLLKHVNVISPLPYHEMLELLVKTRLVITDSGGLQEECSFFNKKCLVCRKVTERPEAVGTSSFLIKHPLDLKDEFQFHIKNHVVDSICPFGDGHSGEKIYDHIKSILVDLNELKE